MQPSHNSKPALRQQLRQRRRSLSKHIRASAAAALNARLTNLPALTDALHIATYLASDGEIDPALGIHQLRQQGKHIYLPVICDNNSLLFARWEEGDQLLPNRFGIAEPGLEARRQEACELDAILMPLVGWDSTGQRLGMGGGFYDRSLQNADQALKIGLAYDLQEVNSLPGEIWDVRLDFIVTESRLIDCRVDSPTG